MKKQHKATNKLPREAKNSKRREKIAAIFDLDGTLINMNTGTFLVKKMLFSAAISPLFLAKKALLLIFQKLMLIDAERYFRDAFLFLCNMDAEKTKKELSAAFLKKAMKKANKKAIKRLLWHKKKGHIIIIATNAFEGFIMPFLKPYADKVFASRLEVFKKNGKSYYTGYSEFVCFGRKKAELIAGYAKKHNISLEKSYAYSDSISDLPMLMSVGKSYAVSPSLALRLLSLFRNIRVL